jgi:hypothetical protein
VHGINWKIKMIELVLLVCLEEFEFEKSLILP